MSDTGEVVAGRCLSIRKGAAGSHWVVFKMQVLIFWTESCKLTWKDGRAFWPWTHILVIFDQPIQPPNQSTNGNNMLTSSSCHSTFDLLTICVKYKKLKLILKTTMHWVSVSVRASGCNTFLYCGLWLTEAVKKCVRRELDSSQKDRKARESRWAARMPMSTKLSFLSFAFLLPLILQKGPCFLSSLAAYFWYRTGVLL